MKRLEFRKYLEMNTIGRHNDGATGAYLPSEFTGSETWQKPHGQQTHLTSQDLVIQDLPKEEIKGKILDINIKKDPCIIKIETDRGLVIQKIPYDYLKSFVVGYTTPEEAKNKTISLTCQGYSKGVAQVRWGTIS
jgi:hypothetical protein